MMIESDKDEVLNMMRVFYASEAVATNGSDEIFLNDIENCVGDDPFSEGYVFLDKDTITGYAMLAKSFSTEFGKHCIWIEDLYLKPEYRNRGTATKFFAFLEMKYAGCVLRLEAEKENESALRTYFKNGFEEMPYTELIKSV